MILVIALLAVSVVRIQNGWGTNRSGGTMTLAGDYTANQLDEIVKAIKTFKH
jgi:hypothetical protein